MKPRDIVHALQRLEMELEGERMAREDVAGQYMRYVEKQHAHSPDASETEALRHELARVKSENRSLRKKIMQFCNAGRSAPTVVQHLLKASLKRPFEVAAEGNVPAEQQDRPPDNAHRGERAKRSRAGQRGHADTAPAPVRLENPVAFGAQRQVTHEGGWGVPSIKVETAVDGAAGKEQQGARKREGGANCVRRKAEARDLHRPIAGDIPLAPTAGSKSSEQPPAAETRSALQDIGNQPAEARKRGSFGAGGAAAVEEAEAVKTENASPPVQEAKGAVSSTPPDQAWGVDDFGGRSPGGRYPGERVYNEAVRNRDQRQAMPGHACHCCTNFLNAVHEDPVERQRIIQQCSKHRQFRRRYETPPDYWELEFLDELEGK